MRYCSVNGCPNNDKKNQNTIFFLYPKSDVMKEKWRAFANNEVNWHPKKYSYICSSHFPDIFVNYHGKRLKQNAVPCIDPSNSEKRKKNQQVSANVNASSIIQSDHSYLSQDMSDFSSANPNANSIIQGDYSYLSQDMSDFSSHQETITHSSTLTAVPCIDPSICEKTAN